MLNHGLRLSIARHRVAMRSIVPPHSYLIGLCLSVASVPCFSPQHGRTPLHYAAAFGYTKTCKTIVDVYRAGMRGSGAEEDRDEFLDLEDEVSLCECCV